MTDQPKGNVAIREKVVNREHWLEELTTRLRPYIKDKTGLTVPAKVKVSCGWPSSRALMGKKGRTLGQCWSEECSAGGYREMFITPAMDDPVEVGATLVHELLHAALPHNIGHKAPFARAAVRAGLEGKPTQTSAGAELVDDLRAMIAEVGQYPHTRLDSEARRKQGTRLLKVVCPVCGYTIRVTRMWLEMGLPECSCGTEMVEEGPVDPDDPDYIPPMEFDIRNYAVEYDLPKHPRFSVRYTRSRTKKKVRVIWHVIDHDAGHRYATMNTRTEVEDFIAAIEEGLFEWPDDNPEAVEGWEADEALIYLDDDEDESPDYPEDQPEDDEEYERVTRERGGA